MVKDILWWTDTKMGVARSFCEKKFMQCKRVYMYIVSDSQDHKKRDIDFGRFQETLASLTRVKFPENGILLVIRKLDQSKPYVHDKISLVC